MYIISVGNKQSSKDKEMLTKDIVKGTKILMSNGWEATTWGSARATTTVCEVEGFSKEAGSVYTHDIVARKEDGKWLYDIEYSKGQLNCKKMASRM